jgi:hypothetical protein
MRGEMMQVCVLFHEVLMNARMVHCKTHAFMLQCKCGFGRIVVSLQIILPCGPSPTGWGFFYLRTQEVSIEHAH